jgi:hypothetical protein
MRELPFSSITCAIVVACLPMMPAATILLLFVAFGLLVLAGVGIGRRRGGSVPRRDRGLMAGLTGVSVAFLFVVLAVAPLVVFPLTVAVVLLVSWLEARQWTLLGAFLIGAGGYLALTQTLRRANDLADPAVTIPGWSPVPLAFGAAALILGAALIIADRAQRA